MYAGRIVERARSSAVLDTPAHPYTIGLMNSVPANVPRGEPLQADSGMAPSPLARPSGCAFRDRCSPPRPPARSRRSPDRRRADLALLPSALGAAA